MSVFATPAAATPFPPPPDRGSPSREARGVAPCASVVRRVGRLVLSFSLSLALSNRALATSLFLFLAPHAFPDFSPPRASRDSPVSAGTSRDGDLGRKLGSLLPSSFHPLFSLGFPSPSLSLFLSFLPSFLRLYLSLSLSASPFRSFPFSPFLFLLGGVFHLSSRALVPIAPSRPRRTRSDLSPPDVPRSTRGFSPALLGPYTFSRFSNANTIRGDAPPTAANSPKRSFRRLRLSDPKPLSPPK